LVHKAHRVFRVLKVTKVIRAILETRVLLAHRVLLALRVILANKGSKVSRVFRVCLEQQGHRERLVHKALLVQMV
jgi:hypothetical protein